MPEENFLLVSLKEDKAKKLAQVISNDTSRRLLDHLAKKKDSTESEIAKELGLAISTVHYNLQHLLEAKLVQAAEYHYSAKGKEVLHYSLTNKFVIIAPSEPSETFMQKLKKILPVAAVVMAAAGAVQLFSRYLAPQEMMQAPTIASRSLPIPEAMPLMAESADAAMKTMDAPMLTQMAGAANETLNETVTEVYYQACDPIIQNVIQPNIAAWFLYGAVFAIIIFVIRDLLTRKK